MFRRKASDQPVSWKRESAGLNALLVEGARRVGKSTVVEEFARNEHEFCVLYDRPPRVAGSRRFLLLCMAHLRFDGNCP